ncbi:MAG: DUF2156 domain-containing protein, partial [Vallitaleaceae bacterium]|nr:DUF2156 domain-containing protein [Vallitaleaceae bacterium]
YSQIREITSCEYAPVTLYMWKDMYHPHLYMDENYLVIFQNYQDVCYSLMPLCKPAFFRDSFEKVEDIFRMMGAPFIMYCVDEKFADFIRKEYSERYRVCEERDLADYIYVGDKLRSLQGKKLSAKRNHINAFMKENQDNKVEAKSLNEEDIEQIHEFLTRWYEEQSSMSTHLDEEWNGIQFLVSNYEEVGAELFGVYINDRLEAFSIGSRYLKGKGAIIHVEKANSSIRGLYPYINRQFLATVFSDVEIVNREDDLGIEGLRKAKNSYDPLLLEKKYVITPL